MSVRVTVKVRRLVPASPSATLTLLMDTDAGPPPAECDPRPSNVSFANPTHWVAGTKASPPLVSPSVTSDLRRKVLS